MDFLGRLPERDRDRLVASATSVRLARGEYLIRRGERGGDIYRVIEGELEVIDQRTQPAVVLDVLGRGAMVGEMAFLDEQARTADVRAAELAVVQRWDRGSLLRILDADPSFAAAFYRALAGMAVERARSVTTTAVSGGLGPQRSSIHSEAAAQGEEVAQRVRDRLEQIEAVVRRDPAIARRDMLTALHGFEETFRTVLGRLGAEDAMAAGEAAGHELHPYVVRARLGDLCRTRPAGHSGDLETLAHIGAGVAVGEGLTGEAMDGWLLNLPSIRGMRERRAFASSILPELLSGPPPFRVLAVGAASARLVAEHVASLGRLGAEVACVDSSRDALTATDAELTRRPTRVRVKLAQVDIASLALERAQLRLPGQHVVVVDGLTDSLPERAAVGLMRWVRQQLVPGGQALVTALAPAPDEGIVRFLLSWPILRRSGDAVSELLAAAGLQTVRRYDAAGTGIVTVGANR